MRESITPESEEHWLSLRSKDLTSTEISALFNMSPYITEFELYHLKVGNIASAFAENDRSKWGTRLQDSIATGIAQDEGWTIKPMKEYMRMPELRLGSSFDFAIGQWGRQESVVEAPGGSIGIGCDVFKSDGLLEIKNVDAMIFRDGWLVDDEKNIEAPPHIELQIQHQMLVSGLDYAWLGALVGGNRIMLSQRKKDEEIFEKIKTKAATFWSLVDAGVAPEPNFYRDFEVIKRLNNYATPGKILDGSGDPGLRELVLKYKEFGKTKKEAEEEQEAIKAQILAWAGDAEKIAGDGWSVSLGMVAEAEISYVRKPYRLFKINSKKTKGE